MTYTDQLRSHRIFNIHELLGRFGENGRDVGVLYSPGESRRCMPPSAQVYSPSFQTNPSTAWYNYGRMSFTGKPSKSVPLAMAWASEKYGITEWGTSPFGGRDKVPLYVLKAAKAFVKEQTKKQKIV